MNDSKITRASPFKAPVQSNQDTGNRLHFPTWLMRAKVHPTNQRVHILQRPSLIKKLDNCLNATLSLVHAPAGYGKSTLYADWRNKLLQRGIKVCWLSLDKEDNELFQLLTYISFALYEGGINFEAAGVKDYTYLRELRPHNFLGAINHVIERQNGKIVLILDDFENLEKEAVEAIIQPLLHYCPKNLHVAIASRDDEKLNIANLETKGLAVCIRSESMGFCVAELQMLLGANISSSSIKEIYRLTEGWPVAIQMLKNEMGNQVDVERILSQIGRSTGILTTYLSEQIFRKLDSELQEFLMDISIHERNSCEFANYLRNNEDSPTLFTKSQCLNALVLPVDRVENVYRLHPLFREFLHKRLITSEPQRAVELHLRSAEWFAQKGHIVMAVKHAVQARKPSKAAQIIEEAGGLTIWLREGLTRLRSALQLLSKQTISNSPRIAIINCIIEIKDGKVYQARKNYEAAYRLYKNRKGGMHRKDKEETKHEFMLLELLLSCYDGTNLSNVFCDQLYEKVSKIESNEHATLAHHYSVLCYAYMQRGLFQQARDHAARAITEFKLLKSLYGKVYIDFHLGEISFAEGKSGDAEKYYQDGLNLARQHFNDDKSIKLIAHIFIAELQYELSQIRGLANIVESIPEQLEKREAWFDIYAAGYITASNIAFRKRGINSSITVIDRACEYAKTQKLSKLIDLLNFQRIDLLLRDGLQQDAQKILTASGLSIERYKNPDTSDIAWRERHTAVCTVILLWIKQNQIDKALFELKPFAAHAVKKGHVRSYMKYEILQSLAYQIKNDLEQSHRHLDLALQMSVSSGFTQPFVDVGEAMKENLMEYTGKNQEQAKKIIQNFAQNNGSNWQRSLSAREHEVLQHLLRGLPNKVIARNIKISENTVRFHLKNIFSKLHVSSRMQAVIVAKQKGIISE